MFAGRKVKKKFCGDNYDLDEDSGSEDGRPEQIRDLFRGRTDL